MAIDELSGVLLTQQLAESLACWRHTIAIDRALGPFTDKHNNLCFRTGYNPSAITGLDEGHCYSELHKSKLSDCVALIDPAIAEEVYSLVQSSKNVNPLDSDYDVYVDSVGRDTFTIYEILAYLKTRPAEEFDGVSPAELPGPSFAISAKPARKRGVPKKKAVYSARKDGARMRIGTRERRGRI